MLPTGEEIFGCADFTFQQDLAPAHSARSTMRWLRDHGIEVLPWPVNSPDLNPIENLWGLMKRRMSKERASTQEKLKGAIRRAWNSVTPEDCYHLVSPCHGSFRQLLQQRVLLPSINYFKLLWQFMFLLNCVEFESFSPVQYNYSNILRY